MRDIWDECNDKGDLILKAHGATSDKLRFYEQVADLNGKLFREVLNSHKEGSFPVVLGGDHSIAASRQHTGNAGALQKNRYHMG